MPRRGEQDVARIGAVEERVQDLCGLELLLAFLRADVVLCAGEAEQVVWEIFVQGDEEVDLVLVVLGLVEDHPGSTAQTAGERLARERQARGLAGIQILRDLGPELCVQARDRGLSRRPVLVFRSCGLVCLEGFREAKRMDHGSVVLVLSQLRIQARRGRSVLGAMSLQRRQIGQRRRRGIIIRSSGGSQADAARLLAEFLARLLGPQRTGKERFESSGRRRWRLVYALGGHHHAGLAGCGQRIAIGILVLSHLVCQETSGWN